MAERISYPIVEIIKKILIIQEMTESFPSSSYLQKAKTYQIGFASLYLPGVISVLLNADLIGFPLIGVSTVSLLTAEGLKTRARERFQEEVNLFVSDLRDDLIDRYPFDNLPTAVLTIGERYISLNDINPETEEMEIKGFAFVRDNPRSKAKRLQHKRNWPENCLVFCVDEEAWKMFDEGSELLDIQEGWTLTRHSLANNTLVNFWNVYLRA